MGSTKFSVANNAVNKQGTNLDQTVSQFSQVGKRFQAAVDELSAWRGAAGDAFRQGTAPKAKAGIDGCQQALRELQSKVSNAGKLYDTHHQEQQQNIQSKTASMNFDSSKF